MHKVRIVYDVPCPQPISYVIEMQKVWCRGSEQERKVGVRVSGTECLSDETVYQEVARENSSLGAIEH
jgi:hypothetical protein